MYYSQGDELALSGTFLSHNTESLVRTVAYPDQCGSVCSSWCRGLQIRLIASHMESKGHGTHAMPLEPFLLHQQMSMVAAFPNLPAGATCLPA